jgi:hypothetical protein
MPNTIKLENCPVLKTTADNIEYLKTYDNSSIESTLKYPNSIHVAIDFFLMLSRKIVRTHNRTPVGNEPIARFENLNQSILTAPVYYLGFHLINITKILYVSTIIINIPEFIGIN